MSIRRTLRRYQALFVGERLYMRNTVSTYIRRIRCVYNKAVEEWRWPPISLHLFKGVFTGVESQRKKAVATGDLNTFSDDWPR